MRKRIWFVLMMMALCGVVAFAADVTGKWTAQLPPPTGARAAARGGNTARELTFNFKVDGETLTGTVTNPRGEEIEIKEGKVSGDDISFANVQVGARDGVEFRTTFRGKVKGDEIEFTREGGPRAGAPTINFTAKKVE